MPSVLAIYASPRGDNSNSKDLAGDLATKLAEGGQVTTRDLIDSDLPYVTNQMIGAYFSNPAEHTDEQKRVIRDSDTYVGEVKAADIIVVGTPMYNFTVPGTLKAWIDLVARVGHTFEYTSEGPKGLLKNKKAYVVATTGGTPIGSDYDFLTPYLKLFFGFIGITDVTIVPAEIPMADPAPGIEKAKAAVAAI